MLVFVYGTLTAPERVERVLETDDAPFAGRATLEGCRRVEGEYPTLAPASGPDDEVSGRLLSVDRDELAALDAYEGVDRGLYVRVAIPRAETDDVAYTYVGDPGPLGVADDVSWPGERNGAEAEESLAGCVHRYVDQNQVVVRSEK